MLGKILDSLGLKEPLELEDIDSAPANFRDERGEKLEEIESRKKEFSEEIRQILEKLQEDVGELEGFEDEKGRDIVNDVVSNIADERRKMIDNFEILNQPEELESELEQFLEDFRSMSRKEAAVMEEVYLKDTFSDSLGKLEARKDKLEEFLESDYRTRKRYRELKKLVEEREKLKSELEKKIQRLEEKDVDSIEQELEEKREELEELNRSDLHEEIKDIKEERDRLEDERDRKHREIGKAMSRMERGLKKLLYEGKISKVSREGSEILRQIRDGKKDELIKRTPENIEDAVEAAKESFTGELLEQNTGEKLVKGAEKLEEISELTSEIEELGEEIEELEKEIDGHEYLKRKKEIESEISSLEKKTREKKDQVSELENSREKIESEIEEIEKKVKAKLKSEFESEIVIGAD